ncbi:Hypp1663 [Branchiostoma lanceolatum]|uniref:Hypp1663 protein n=1 Tax=Branchiostoma lanceolatum TaxID=7740 RepID=A0A8K0ELP7_BRALA|nr:Hypp1663 [Branchiostoma lanceolatum]
MVPVLSEAQLKRLEDHKYSVSGVSVTERVLQVRTRGGGAQVLGVRRVRHRAGSAGAYPGAYGVVQVS